MTNPTELPPCPKGWRLVPVEPTPEMLRAYAPHTPEHDLLIRAIWSALLSAAPSLTTPARAVGREEVAKVIDPHAFRQWQSMYDYSIRVGDSEGESRSCADWAHGKECNEALAKADAIIALIGGE